LAIFNYMPYTLWKEVVSGLMWLSSITMATISI
jgi:hypothetical protein